MEITEVRHQQVERWLPQQRGNIGKSRGGWTTQTPRVAAVL